MLHHLIQTKKKHQEWCFIQLSNLALFQVSKYEKRPQKIATVSRLWNGTPKTKRLGWKHWRHWIPSQSPGPRARFPRFCLHPSKIEWNQIPTEPVQQVARLAVRYSGFFRGPWNLGPFVGDFLDCVFVVGCNLLTILGFFEPPRTRFKASKLGSYIPKSLTWLTCFQWWELQVGNLLFRIAHFQVPC